MSVARVCLLLVWLLPLPLHADDPTRPPFLEVAPQQGERMRTVAPLKLSMILQEGERQRAVINGRLLAVADRIGSAQVISIQQDHVVMARAGRQFRLELPIGTVKTASKGKTDE